MSLRGMSDHAGEWLRGAGPYSEIVISSRVRLARNLVGFSFVNSANRRQRYEVMERCREQITSGRVASGILWVNLVESPELDRELLVERHLISRQHVKCSPDLPRAVAIDHNETFSIMVNEEDHLRMQVLRSGMRLTEAHDQINRIDNVLEENLDFAYSSRWGYLTACPTNVGTGIRVSVMLHLPALKLTGEIEKVRRAARDLRLAVRGLFGEGSEAVGDLYQISNQTTLGRCEEEILADFEHTIVPQIIAYEQQARAALIRHRPVALDDKIWRAWATLTHARTISAEETLQLLSLLRLGVNIGRIEMVDIRTINELFLLVQSAHLQRMAAQEMDQAARREARSELIRRRLSAS